MSVPLSPRRCRLRLIVRQAALFVLAAVYCTLFWGNLWTRLPAPLSTCSAQVRRWVLPNHNAMLARGDFSPIFAAWHEHADR